MRCKKNITCNIRNITLNLENIISFYRNITSHFTGSAKIITLSLVIIILSFANMALCSSNIFNNSNVSALDYSSNVGIGFTFNPTLSINISSSDLVISNLKPGTTEDSNSINVSVATNAAYGYTLSANVGDDIHNNSNLTHTNNTDVFSSIATNADLASLDTDNTWGYTSKLSNETTWSNYNGLSSFSNTILLDNNNTADSTGSVDFKISAKASNTQPSGEYTGTINFIAITKPTPMNLAESYFAHGKTRYNGYYTMQDMTSTICNKTEAIGAQLQVLDIRDYKLYWISKLADNHCWMTQNLDLDLDSNRTYTHWDTDLGWSTENGNTIDENATWQPIRSTINFSGTNVSEWRNSGTEPFSANPGDVYYYTSNSDANDIQYNSLQECTEAGHSDCLHYHAGNYYNWSAAVASNNTTNLVVKYEESPDSICPSEWRLFKNSSNSEAKKLINSYDITSSRISVLRLAPLYFTRPGFMPLSNSAIGVYGGYWSSTVFQNAYSYNLFFSGNSLVPERDVLKHFGFSMRCLAR